MKARPRRLAFGASKHHDPVGKPRRAVLVAVVALCCAAIAVAAAAWVRLQGF